MAPFHHHPQEWTRLDWRILLNSAISLYHQPEILAEDTEWFRQNGYQVHAFDCTRWESEEVFHLELMRTFQFPAYYGKTLDALREHLGNIDVPAEGGCVLRLSGFNQFAERFPDIAQELLDILEMTSRRFILTGQRLIALVQSDDPQISFLPVGVCPVTWNQREWVDSVRGA